MERLELLILKARQESDNVTFSDDSGIQDSEFVRWANRAQTFIQLAIMNLYPTPTRLALLRDVGAQRIVRQPSGDSTHEWAKVTGRMAELEHAGWVRLVDLSGDGTLCWLLTDAGRRVLGGAP